MTKYLYKEKFAFAVDTNAQTYKYYSTDFAYKTKDRYGYWSGWSDWEPSRCLVSISLDKNIINIYSYDHRNTNTQRT